MSEPINLLRKTIDGPKITGSDAGRTWHWAVPRIGMLFDELETEQLSAGYRQPEEVADPGVFDTLTDCPACDGTGVEPEVEL